MKILVSACLLGENCKYNGGNNYCERLTDIIKSNEVISVCPEVMGGLPIPRKPGEIHYGKVIDTEGVSIDAEFRRGAQLVLDIAKREKIEMAILQSRSPSCGVNQIYDGTFSHRLIVGMGVCARLLKDNGFRVVDVEDL